MPYTSFSQIQARGKFDDFRIHSISQGWSGILIMAPHGGVIEPKSSLIASRLARRDFSLYDFQGLNESNPRELHLTSHRFDEPIGAGMARESEIVLTVHVMLDSPVDIYVGGLHDQLKRKLIPALSHSQYSVEDAINTKYPGVHPENICNRGRQGRGIQLELNRTFCDRLESSSLEMERFTSIVRRELLESVVALLPSSAIFP